MWIGVLVFSLIANESLHNIYFQVALIQCFFFPVDSAVQNNKPSDKSQGCRDSHFLPSKTFVSRTSYYRYLTNYVLLTSTLHLFFIPQFLLGHCSTALTNLNVGGRVNSDQSQSTQGAAKQRVAFEAACSLVKFKCSSFVFLMSTGEKVPSSFGPTERSCKILETAGQEVICQALVIIFHHVSEHSEQNWQT